MKAIEFEKVRFSYDDSESDIFDATVGFSLDGIDFSVEEGEFVAVLGHNGSGKSTLARLTNGLLTPTDGKITVMGLDATNPKNLYKIRKQVGIVFQNPDNQTVASIVEDDIAFGPENIGIKRAEIGERIDFALNAVGMQNYRYSTTSRLSGGQKQRIAIAGVLALKPRVMIIDESTAMLDPKGRKEVIDVVLKLNKEEKITVVLITHFPEEALLADRAVLMNHGKIVKQGKPQEVLKDEESLRACSLTLPKLLQIQKQLNAGGLSVKETFSTDEFIEDLATVLPKMQETVTPNNDETVPQSAGVGDILCENLHFTYNPSSPFATQALLGVDMQVSSGDFFGIIGHTGSGKSTFVQHLNALIKLPTAEKKYKEKKNKKVVLPKTKLIVNGFDLSQKTTDFRELRKKVGMVFQYPEYQLFAEKVFDDIAFGLKNFASEMTEEEIKTAVKDAMETVGLSYEEYKDRSPFELSGGQKRRVAIAGVIVTKPEILILDEPAAGLDPLGKQSVMELLHKIHADWCKTVIIVSHDMDEISENCNRCAVFADGKAVAVDTPKAIFTPEIMQKTGLELPLVKRLIDGLKERGITVNSDITSSAFVTEILKKAGAGTSISEGGQANA